jgi:hypothetical protein
LHEYYPETVVELSENVSSDEADEEYENGKIPRI